MNLLRISLLALVIPFTGCATSSDIQQARAEFYSGSPTQALNTLENADVSERDALLLLLDRGAVAFSAGEYERAKRALLDANDLIEAWDEIRISEQSATLLTSEWAKRYRGEYSEQLWVHSYLMMTFLILNDAEGAAVEARRALARIDDHEDSLGIDWFTRALIGLSFEAAGQHDSAQVEYRKLVNHPQYDGRWDHVIQRHTKSIGRDPIVNASLANQDVNGTPTQLGNDEGELIIFLQTGHIDTKLASSIAVDIDLHIAFPFYGDYRISQPIYSVTTDNEPVPADEIDTHLVTVSSRALAARGKTIAAKQVARIAAKRAAVNLASNEDDVLGGVLQVLLFITEQADTRSWETLPGWQGLLRVPLAEGQHNIDVTVRHRGRAHRVNLGDVTIRAGGLHFTTFRTDLPLPQTESAPLNTLTGNEPTITPPTANVVPSVNSTNSS